LFGRLKKAFASIVEKLSTRAISEKELASVTSDFLMELVECDVAFDVAENIVDKVKEKLLGLKVKRGVDVRSLVKDALKEILLETLKNSGGLDFIETVKKLRETTRPVIILFLGVNGVGKTTTIAKIAIISASDTYRAGAQEQLEFHAKRVGVPIVKHKYGSDPAAVAYDAINFAKAKGFDVVLVDTAGRMHIDVDLVEELKKVVRVTKPHMKILVVDALTGNDAVEQAIKFNEAVGVDAVIIAKADADVKGGVSVSIAHAISKPIIYVGTGQKYEDLQEFSPEWFVEKIIGE